MKRCKELFLLLFVIIFSLAFVNAGNASIPKNEKNFSIPINETDNFESALYGDGNVYPSGYVLPYSPQAGNFESSLKIGSDIYTGASVYDYQIDVPKGTNSLQPKLSIYYNSQRATMKQGTLGAGWDFTQSYIARNPNNTLSNSNTSDDEFYLILNGGFYDLEYSSDNRFHTKIESFFYITNKTGGNNTNGNYWNLKTKDGTEYIFGFNNESELISNVYNYTIKWSLDLVNDTYGNSIFYSYAENPYANDLGSVYIEKIEYNNDLSRRIDFLYENGNRPDILIDYSDGNKEKRSRRLKEIITSVNDSLVKRYVLEYTKQSDINSFITLLSNITEYGNDNSSSLPATKFNYNEIDPGWDNNDPLTLPTGFTTYYYFIDVNGDGLTDVADANGDGGPTNIWINNGTGVWYDDPAWIMPTGFAPYYYFVDINGDGLVDIADANSVLPSPTDTNIWFNNGTGWSLSSRKLPTGFTDYYFFVDVNGDGLVDVVDANAPLGYDSTVWLNNGTTWKLSSWKTPTGFADYYFFVDINGDGLVDIADANEGTNVWINNGTGWFDDSSWVIPEGFTEYYYFADVDNDGLPDMVDANTNPNIRINNGTGWEDETAWVVPTGFAPYYQLVDLNGDGVYDIADVNEGTNAWTNNGTKTYLLKNITNQYGGTVSIDYEKSTSIDNTGDDNVEDLGFNVWVVTNKTEDNGINGNHNSQSIIIYNYSGGFYDYIKDEFRGFNFTEEKIEQKIIKHWFHQDDARKGKEYRTEFLDNQNNIYFEVLQTWNSTNLGKYYEIELVEVSELSYDGDSSYPKIKNISYEYDDFGNIKKIHNKGDIENSDDDKYEYYGYLNNSNKWIVGKLKNYSLYDSDNSTKLKERFYSYDGLSYGSAPTKGSLTREEHWLNGGSNPIITYGYDSFGNIVNQTNALGNIVRYYYDSRNTFVNKITDAKGFVIRYNYNLGTGNLNYILDSNSKFTNYTYDVFGRITKEIKPYDSNNYSTKEYSYSYDGIAPEKMKISSREQNNTANTYDVYEFYDGFGRIIQTKTEGNNNKQIVKDIFYDEVGRTDRESNPYFVNFGENYTNANSSVAFTNYSYDVLNRVINITNPDGTSNNITYFKWNVTFYDENENKTRQTLDAYGQIIEIREYSNGESYITKYSYDDTGNLISIADALNNFWNYTYDSLGRKTSFVDPDTGLSNYTYDANGNIIKQISGGGNLVTGDGYYRTYDGFGRLKAIYQGSNTSILIENYTYDPNGNRIKTYNKQTNTTIYTPFKEFMQIRNSTGIFNYTYVYDENVLVARVNPGGSKWFYHADHLGSTSLITNQSGGIVEEIFYMPYGTPIGNSDGEVRLYEGKEYNSDLNQYYYGARYYDPYKQIFTQPDSIIPNIYDPQQLNIYAFERGNPYKYVDENGNYIETALDIAFITYDLAEIRKEPSVINFVSLGADVAGAALPFVTGLGVGVKAGVKGVKALDKADNVLDAAKVGGEVTHNADNLKSFTKSNFRENVLKQTGESGIGTEAHHNLPQQFQEKFSDVGINIHDPNFGSVVGKTEHRGTAKSFNKEFSEFFEKNKGGTLDKKSVLDKARDISNKFGFKPRF